MQHKIPEKEKQKTERQLLEGFIQSNVSVTLYQVKDSDKGNAPPEGVAMVGLIKMKDATVESIEKVTAKLTEKNISGMEVQAISFTKKHDYVIANPEEERLMYPNFMKKTNIGLCAVPALCSATHSKERCEKGAVQMWESKQMAVYVRTQKIPVLLQGVAMHDLWAREPTLLENQNVTITNEHLTSNPVQREENAFAVHFGGRNEDSLQAAPFRLGKYYPQLRRYAVTNREFVSSSASAKAVLFNPDDYMVQLDFSLDSVPMYPMSYLCAPATYIRDCQVCFERFRGPPLGLNSSPFRNKDPKFARNPALFCFQHYHITGDGRDIRNPRHPGTLCSSCLHRHSEMMLKEGKLFVRCPAPGCGRSLFTGEIKKIVNDELYEKLITSLKEVEAKNEQDYDFPEGMQLKLCPKCNVRIEKNEGCDSMNCWRCDHNFQWSSAIEAKRPQQVVKVVEEPKSTSTGSDWECMTCGNTFQGDSFVIMHDSSVPAPFPTSSTPWSFSPGGSEANGSSSSVVEPATPAPNTLRRMCVACHSSLTTTAS